MRRTDRRSAEARAVPPSTLSLLGLARHLSEVERTGSAAGGRPRPPGRLQHTGSPDGDFDDLDSHQVDDVWRAYDAGRGGLQAHPRRLAAAANPPAVARAARRNVRWVLLHLVEEYARHNGHADLLREVIDGGTGE